mmetsp:Transcript_17850/g.40573  ORF Transcript_17850/g.40573 Transcript_17850/m.40573 type:complete len:84 (+) Transcript_17850:1090-1341(+)
MHTSLLIARTPILELGIIQLKCVSEFFNCKKLSQEPLLKTSQSISMIERTYSVTKIRSKWKFCKVQFFTTALVPAPCLKHAFR